MCITSDRSAGKKTLKHGIIETKKKRGQRNMWEIILQQTKLDNICQEF